MSEVKQSDLWIGGEHVAPSGGEYFDDLNPQDDSLYSRVASGTAEDMDRAVRVARDAFKANRGLLARDRETWFMNAASLVERDFKEYMDILVDEVGSPAGKADFEVNYCISALRAAAGVPRSLRGDVVPSDYPGVYSMAIREPVGVVAAISPFNVPLLKVTKQGAMPLACGNAVVQLPSEFASQVSIRFARTLHEAGVPAGLFNVVTGDPFAIGDVLTTHKLVNSITFCGSPRVGVHVAQLAAKGLKPITLELGGKSPLIVLDDADLDEAVQAAAMSTFFFQGQACMASSRIFLQRGIADAFRERFIAAAGQMGMGDLREMSTAVGPIISERQRERVRRHIEDARDKGVEVLAGGEWDGNRCRPTVLWGVTEEMEVCREETFGPVTSLYVFDTVDEAVERANDTEYGLSFSVFTRDIDTAMDIALRAESGAVHINRPTIQDEPCPPFGGQGISGLGREGTEADLDTLTEWKWITMRLKHGVPRVNISRYLLERLNSLGVDHVFGIPGDFILPFFQEMANSDVEHIATCNELNAGYAADGYARLRGLGAVAVTYGPGSFSLVNACAGAYAESVPLLVISGGPHRDAYREQHVLHHVLPDRYDASLNILAEVTAYSALLDDPEQAPAQIDEALNICLSRNKPVFLEIPADVQTCECPAPTPLQRATPVQDDSALATALADIVARVEKSGRTVIVPGHEVHREQLQDKVLQLLDRTGLPAASMFIGKAEFLERHPQCIGAYQGAGSLAQVSEYLESADTVLFLGVVLSDFNLGGFTAGLRPEQVVSALDRQVTTSDGNYGEIPLSALVDGLLESLPEAEADSAAPRHGFSHLAARSYEPQADAPMTNKRFYDRIATFLRDGDIVAADAGCAINATHMQFPAGATYIASCYWASIGMGFGAAFGACLAARPGRRVIALEGDGSFQMSAQELSSMSRYDCPAIVFVVNNRGYTAERLIHDGPFNDIADWRYHRLPEAWGGTGMEVRTEGDLEKALAAAESHTGPGPLLIEVHVDPLDASEAFTLMSETLRG